MHKWLQGSMIGALPAAAYGLWRYGADVDTVGVGLAAVVAAVVPLLMWGAWRSAMRQQL